MTTEPNAPAPQPSGDDVDALLIALSAAQQRAEAAEAERDFLWYEVELLHDERDVLLFPSDDDQRVAEANADTEFVRAEWSRLQVENTQLRRDVAAYEHDIAFGVLRLARIDTAPLDNEPDAFSGPGPDREA